jgi:hypothetical protein
MNIAVWSLSARRPRVAGRAYESNKVLARSTFDNVQ